MEKEFYFALRAGAVACILSLTALFVSAQDSNDSVETAVLLLEAAADVPVEVSHSLLPDLVSVIATTRGHPIALNVPVSLSAPQSGNRSH